MLVQQAKLGTSYEKVMRFKELAADLARQFDEPAVALTERAGVACQVRPGNGDGFRVS
ncbi:MAG: hypothetical protein R2864_12935 [Syntrophotaleaceae bacterium]